MCILDRYVSFRFWAGFSFASFSFIFLYIIGDLIGHLDDIVTNNVPLVVIFKYYIAMLPIIISTVFPLAVILSALFLLSNMGYRGELVAIRGSGQGLIRVVVPILFSSLLISSILFWINEKFLPNSYSIVNVLKRGFFKRSEVVGSKDVVLKYISFSTDRNNLVFISRCYPNEGMIRGLLVVLQDSQQRVIGKIIAQEGKLLKATGVWRLKNVIVYSGEEGTRRYYQVKDIQLDFDMQKVLERKGSLSSLSIKQLCSRLLTVRLDNESRVNFFEMESYLFYKIMLIIAPILLFLMGIGFVSHGVRKMDVFLSFAIGTGLFFVFHVANTIALLIARMAIVEPVAVYSVLLISFGVVAVWGWMRSSVR